MSLALLQELSPNYTDTLKEGLHALLVAAASARDYGDVSIISSALDSLKAQDNVVEIGYRNGEVKAEEEPPAGLDNIVENTLYDLFHDLDNEEVTSFELLDSVKQELSSTLPEGLAYVGSYNRPYWKVSFERAIEKLLNEGLIKKVSRYKYAAATTYNYDPLLWLKLLKSK